MKLLKKLLGKEKKKEKETCCGFNLDEEIKKANKNCCDKTKK